MAWSWPRVLIGVVCLATPVLAAQDMVEGRSDCIEEATCEAPGQDPVLLLQRQVRLDGQIASAAAAQEHDKDAIAALWPQTGYVATASANSTWSSAYDASKAVDVKDGLYPITFSRWASKDQSWAALTIELTPNVAVIQMLVTFETCLCGLRDSLAVEIRTPDGKWGHRGSIGDIWLKGGRKTYTYLMDGKVINGVRLINTDQYDEAGGPASEGFKAYSIWHVRFQISKVDTPVIGDGPTPAPAPAVPCCPAPPEVNPLIWQPSKTPVPKLCNYPPTVTYQTMLQTTCGELCHVFKKFEQVVTAGNKLPAAIAASIISEVEKHSGKWFNDPIQHRDLEITAYSFELVGELYGSFTRGAKLRTLMFEEDIDDFFKLEDQVKTWVNQKQKAKLAKVAATGALDMVGRLAGPVGVAASLASAALGFWETSSQADILKNLAEQIMAEAQKMISAQAYQEQTKKVRQYLTAFTNELEYVLGMVERIGAELPENGGIMQFIFLNALQSDLATTRYEWMPFFGEEQMVIVVAGHSMIAYEVHRKLYQHVHEYFTYVRRLCAVEVNMQDYLYPPYQAIPICVADGNTGALTDALRGPEGVTKKLVHLIWQGGVQKFLPWWDQIDKAEPWCKKCVHHQTQPGNCYDFSQTHLYTPNFLQLGEEEGGRANHSQHSKHLVQKPMAMLEVDLPPVQLGAPRSHWEAKFHKVCGPGLACFRGELSKQKSKEFMDLAKRLGKTINNNKL